MEVKIAGKDIIANYISIEKESYRGGFRFCLPSDADGCFHLSKDGRKIVRVGEKDIWLYPFVKINTYYNDEYEGISDQGISLLAFDIESKSPDEISLEIGIYPSFISVLKDKVQFIFRLKKFVPRNATPETFRFLDDMMELIGATVKGRHSDILINPFHKDVTSYIFCSEGLELHEIKKISRILASEEHVKAVRGKGGRNAAARRAENTKRAMADAIRTLQSEGKLVTKAAVVKLSGRSKVTVLKHWDEVSAKVEMSEGGHLYLSD